MRLDEQQVTAAKDRAREVVDGFKTVRNQHARDALNLAETCELKDRQIAALKKRMLADELMAAAKRTATNAQSMKDLFTSLGL